MRRLAGVLPVLVVVLGLVGGGLSVIHAQGGLDFTQPPTFGEVDLVSGYTPDPFEAAVVAGGTVDVMAELGNTCEGMASGFAASAPDFRLHYTSGQYLLRVMFAGDGDTTLVVNAPDGTWHCDDDGGGLLQPMVEFGTPDSGQYDIWVGTYYANATVTGTLYITETEALPAVDFTDAISALPVEAIYGALPVDMAPAFGMTELLSGYEDDPFVADTTAGGDVNVAEILPEACNGTASGYISAKPSFVLNYTNGQYPLTFFYYNLDEADTTMVVMAPDGNYYCDDDGAGLLQPAVTFDSPASGRYYVWTGAYSPDNFVLGALLITETDMLAQDVADILAQSADNVAGGLDWTQTPTYGEVTLESGFQPDPSVVDMVAGGPVSISDAVGSICDGPAVGYSAAAPDYRMQYTAGNFPLRVFFVSADNASDTTLVVNAPDGSWYCNDDAAGTLDGMVEFQAPLSGQYDIWVGTFGPDQFATGALFITEAGYDPAHPASSTDNVPPGGNGASAGNNGPGAGPGTGPGAGPGPGGLDTGQPPAYGEVTLVSGFQPDPVTLDMVAGGPVSAFDVIGQACNGRAAGFVAAAPDFRVQYTAGNFPLRVFFVSADNASDTTLVVNGPDGLWYCNDDAAGTLDGMVEFQTPLSGQYDIWVGTFNPDAYAPGILYVTESGYDPANTGAGGK